MDNFMDKLARRFNAGEVMRANAAAEAREMKRAKEQAAEYERMMQEMRRLHLKNVEVTEQVQQLIQSGIEQFEEYDSAADMIRAAKNDEGQKLLDEKLETLLEQTRQVEQAILDMKEDNAAADADNRLMECVDGVKNELAEVVTASRVQVTERIDGARDEITDTVVSTQEEIAGAIAGTKQDLSEAIAGTKEEISEAVIGTKDTIEEKFLKLQFSLQQIQEKLNPEDSNQKEVLESVQATLNTIQPIITGLQDYVHRENVKVYRNVQAVILDVATQKSRELGDRMDVLERQSLSAKTAMPVMVITMLLAAGALVLQILQMLNLM